MPRTEGLLTSYSRFLARKNIFQQGLVHFSTQGQYRRLISGELSLYPHGLDTVSRRTLQDTTQPGQIVN
ncbi:hypothetical protein I7I50_11138 [Histoplasma capsulatum G186AR]|uniref:Uncharacterized protein n=1 Tax=Ajellomyces capsulatus TaxID=5037 RepID=A0A8H8D759_AJECA|nr:hypothetical protein I7I52_02377 [Histoplasma capsulatum]QSS69739.1 hypothetical protein I7I50_11138 [Histoplasma capsulatum G186AR]